MGRIESEHGTYAQGQDRIKPGTWYVEIHCTPCKAAGTGNTACAPKNEISACDGDVWCPEKRQSSAEERSHKEFPAARVEHAYSNKKLVPGIYVVPQQWHDTEASQLQTHSRYHTPTLPLYVRTYVRYIMDKSKPEEKSGTHRADNLHHLQIYRLNHPDHLQIDHQDHPDHLDHLDPNLSLWDILWDL